ncbi:MAG TPA: HAMP domain-containing sensor histidine kinase [Candidatus Thiothrix moscowensis]|uniref:sensor histidine kinase n=1 Tax=unclassified Thiothrix TaxID=2636184 RepID=UPI0025EFE6AF|nr:MULTISPECIES: HAMP domain-containing sensor histidine kinase [unclassified Thiothrix]HRJ54184.1 HAMP domain-containing sensor histidine kinase [Candidatus Thiothrix moscowensis]HRJ94324.1 HAMP domain-containing sensor histidine kinase [Candidatus Thiothrix moscowensis]
MNVDPSQRTRLLRLGIPLLLVWGMAWLLGIAILAKVAIDLRAELRETDLDTELALYATSVYGLTWFDQQGKFHDEVLRLEHDLLDAPYDIWVIEPGNPPTRHFAPTRPHFNLTNFTQLQTSVMGQGQKLYLDGQDTDGKPYRLHAIPTFLDQGDTSTPKAMIITVADPTPGQVAYQAFVQRIVGASALLGILGLLVGVGLTAWSLRPVLAALRQRERFLAATAHELRTPVAALRSICESAQRGDEAPQLALSRMDGLLRSATHTLEDLLLFARLDAGASLERQPVRLDLLVETLLPDDDSVTLDAAATVVNLDPRLVTVAVRNLLENARKHGVASAQPHIHVTVAGVQVTVEDQGKGFAAELLARRETDFVLSPTQGGTGLGLAIVNMVARLHGGALRLENRVDGGARVTVSFA